MCSGSRKVVGSGLRQKLFENNHRLDEYFEVRTLSYGKEHKEKKTCENFKRCSIVCNNLSGLVENILKERSLAEHSIMMRIDIDGGGGFLKICISIFDSSDEPSQFRTGIS